jgi:protein-disulfide isomerase
MVNAAVVAGLVWASFDPNKIWQTATVALFFFMSSNHLISRERLLETVLSENPKASDENRSEIIANYVNGLKQRYEVEIFLQKPSLPLTRVDIEGSPTLGPADARVLVVEFSDLLCPACRAAYDTTRRIREKYGDQIRWVFKDFPLERHKGARKAAQAAHCAGEQGQFWEYHDVVIHSEEEKPDAGDLKAYAQKLGLDKEQFGSCLNNGKYHSRIENDIQTGKKAGISAIPTFIINGKMVSGKLSFDEFKQKIDEALKTASAMHRNPARG